MKFAVPVWTVECYAANRRKHRHRCRCCGKVIEAGSRVVMARIAGGKTWAVHDACAEKRHSPEYTWREVMRVWAFGYQIKCFGLSETNPRDWSKIEQYRRVAGLAT